MFDMIIDNWPLVVVGVIAFIIIASTLSGCINLNREYERAVFFRLGRLKTTKGPGLYWLWPLTDKSVKVDLRTITQSLATQETVSKDGVSVKVNAVLWFKAMDVVKVVTEVVFWQQAVIQAAETALRDVIGQSELDDLLKERTTINAKLLEMLKTTTAKWGIQVESVEIKDLDLPEAMQRAFAREAESIREARARITKAKGELDASKMLAEAAQTINASPGALEIRRLQTLTEIGAEHNSTIVMMMPTELLTGAAALTKLVSK